jgi:hypothetical protein
MHGCRRSLLGLKRFGYVDNGGQTRKRDDPEHRLKVGTLSGVVKGTEAALAGACGLNFRKEIVGLFWSAPTSGAGPGSAPGPPK